MRAIETRAICTCTLSTLSVSEQPLVSVVVPSYNHRPFLPTAIDSALQQTYGNLELIVVDDGSTDGSPAYLQGRAAVDSRLRVVCRENRGAHATLNEGIALAKGELVAILNSDDEYTATRIARMVQLAREHGHPFFAFSAVEIIDEDGRRLEYAGQQSGPVAYYRSLLEKYQGRPTQAFFWVGNMAMTTSNFFFSRVLFDEVGPFAPLRYLHDWDWALRAQRVGSVLRVDEPLVRYRVHGSNTIGERNAWKHVAENAYVFASALANGGLADMARRSGKSEAEILALLLQDNKSFAPVPVLSLLALAGAGQDLAALLANGTIETLMPTLIGQTPRDLDLMQSVEQLRKKFAQADAERLSMAAFWRDLKKRGARLRRRLRQRFGER